MTNEQTVPPVQPPQSISEEPFPSITPKQTNKSSHPLIFVIIGILLLMLGGIGGYYVLTHQLPYISSISSPKGCTMEAKLCPDGSSVGRTGPNCDFIPCPSLIPTQSIIPSPIATTESKDYWLTYSNKNVVFTFKYPKGMELREDNTIALSLLGPSQKKDTEFYDGIILSFSLPFKIENMPLKDYVYNQIEESKQTGEIIKPLEEITIGQQTGYTYTARGLGEWQYIFLQSPDKTWTVEIVDGTKDPTNQGFQIITDKILSTFSFVQ